MVKMYKASTEIESCEILSCTYFSKIFGIEENFKPKLNLFLANVLPILYPLKTPEKLWVSGVFRGYKMGALARNRLRFLLFKLF